jgi:O-antigen/teichoic acid export membrane protein
LKPIRRLAGQTLIYGLSSILGRLLNWLLVPLHVRIFAPDAYGVVTEMYSYVALFFVVLTYGMETAFFRFARDEDPKKVYSTALVSLVTSSTGFILLILLFGTAIAGWLDYANHVEYIIMFAIVIALDALTAIPFARLRQENRGLRFATLRVLNIGINVIFNLVFLLLFPWILKEYPGSAWAGLVDRFYDPAIGVGYIFIANLIASAATFLMVLPMMLDIPWKFDKKLWNQMFHYAWPLLIMGLAGTINESFDRILLKHLLPDKATAMAQLGIYGACYKIPVIMTLFVQTYRFAAEPFFFAESKDKNAALTYARVMNLFVIVCALIFLGTMVYLDILKIYVSPEYYEGLKVVPVLLLANFFLGVFYNLSVWYKLTNKTLFGAKISLVGAAVSLLLNFTLIPVFGYMGSAWAHFICYFLMMVISWHYGQKYFPIPYDVKKFFAYMGYAVLLFAIHAMIPFPTELVKLAAGTVFLVLFAVPVVKIEGLHTLLIRK